MIALDTNVLVRIVTADSAAERAVAASVVARLSPDRPGFVAREVLAELVWVLERSYRRSRADIADVLEAFFGMETLHIEAAADAMAALDAFRTAGADFADLMILAAARRAGCETLYTFDRQLGRADGATLLEGA